MTTAETAPKPSLTVQAAWLLVAKTIGFVLSFAAPLLIVRVLSQNDFGLYKQVFQVVSTALPLVSLGFHLNAFYFLPRNPEQGGKIVFNILLVNLVFGLAAFAVLVAFPAILGRVMTEKLMPWSSITGALLFVWLFGFFLEMVATANQDVRYSSVFIVTSQLSRAVLMAGAALLFGTLQAVLWAGLLQGVLQSMVLLWYLQHRFPEFWKDPDWDLLGEQARYAVPLGVASIASMLQNDLHMYFVANRYSPAEFAIYAVGCSQLPLTGLIRDSVNSVMLPRVAFLAQEGRGRAIGEVLASALRKLSAVYWPVVGFMTVCGYDFLILMFRPAYAASWPVFLVNIWIMPLTMLMIDPVMRAYKEHMPYLLKVRFVCSLLLAVLIHFGLVFAGLPGALAAVGVTVLVERVILTARMVDVLELTWRDVSLLADTGKLALAAGIAAIPTYALRAAISHSHPAVILSAAGVLYCVVYVIAVFALRILQPVETAMVRKKLGIVRRVLRMA